MNRILALTFFSLILFQSFIEAQVQQPRCGTTEYIQQLIAEDPSYAEELQRMEQILQNSPQTYNLRSGQPALITIPVVVHVIHNGEPEGTGANISVAQVQSQIDVLNEDFRRLNADTNNTPVPFRSIAADTRIEFCLASIDPQGNPTNGINRVNGGQANWSNSNAFDSQIKPATVWPRNSYLNMWVCNFGSNGLLGYATPPGGNASRDGVVIGHLYFGRYPANPFLNSYNRGRTATHEVGHWLNLQHIWGDDNGSCSGSDGVSDTPNQADAHYGCPSFPQISCNNGPNGDMFMNYMDYTQDNCMNIFTQGQATRMINAVNNFRNSLYSSQGCEEINLVTVNIQVIDSITNMNIPEGTVGFSAPGRKFEFIANNSGIFTNVEVNEGSYTIYAGAWGYQTKMISGVSMTTGTNLTIKVVPAYYDDFVLDYGWETHGNAATGHWVRGVPVGTTNNNVPCNPGADVPNDFGEEAYVTGNGGGAAGNDDVDDGVVILESPYFDLSKYNLPQLSYYRWFCNAGGSGTPNDTLVIKLLNGSTFVELERVHSGSPDLNQWVNKTFEIPEFIQPTSTMKLVVETSDMPGSGHLVEAGFDKFEIIELQPTSVGVSVKTEAGIQVWPNPANDRIYIRFPEPVREQVLIQVFNMAGQKMMSLSQETAQSTETMFLDVSTFDQGLYLVYIQTASSVQTARISILR